MKNAEIEAKLKVDSHESIRRKLKKLRAKMHSQQKQTDIYYDDENRTLTRTDRCLRLRCSKIGRVEKNYLTYKGPREKDDFKKRAQIETRLEQPRPIVDIFQNLGFEKKLVVEKKRQTWLLNKCEIALDELPLLGTFVEIEGPDAEKIDHVKKKLGLEQSKHITRSYACLVEQKTSGNKCSE